MTWDQMCDILIIGGGPAGSTAAYILASKGYKVILADKRQFPRPKLCAGLLTWKTMDLIHSVFHLTRDDLVEQGLVAHQTRDYRIYRKSSEIARGRLDYPFHLVDRSNYDFFWLRKAADAGARIITGHSVKKIEPVAGCAEFVDGRIVRAKTIVGADGVWSVTRRSLFNSSLHKNRWKRNLAMTMETWLARTDGESARNYAALHFGFVPWGYAWSFPRAGDCVVGIAALRSKGGQPLVKGFDGFLKHLGVEKQCLQAIKGYPLPLGNFINPPGVKRVLLTGDACGLADPLLGEGIYYAHRSAQIAARCIITCGPGSDHLSRAYQQALAGTVLRDLRWIRFLRNLMFFGGQKRKFRGLAFLLRVMPKRVEDAIQGRTSFSALLDPRSIPKEPNSRSTRSAHP